MAPNLRILLLDQNRYLSLLIEREFAQQMPRAIISKFSDPRAAVEELATNQYQAAVVDHYTLAGADPRFYVLPTGVADHAVPIVLMLPVNQSIHAEERFNADELIVKQVGFQKQLPELVSRAVERREEKLAELLRTPVSSDGESLLRIITCTLSHEINNPLMAILGSSELMLEMRDRLDDELIDKLRMIHDSAQRIQTRLSQLANLRQPNLRNSSTGYLITTQK